MSAGSQPEIMSPVAGSEGQRPGFITARPNGLGNGDNKIMQAEGLRHLLYYEDAKKKLAELEARQK